MEGGGQGPLWILCQMRPISAHDAFCVCVCVHANGRGGANRNSDFELCDLILS